MGKAESAIAIARALFPSFPPADPIDVSVPSGAFCRDAKLVAELLPDFSTGTPAGFTGDTLVSLSLTSALLVLVSCASVELVFVVFVPEVTDPTEILENVTCC